MKTKAVCFECFEQEIELSKNIIGIVPPNPQWVWVSSEYLEGRFSLAECKNGHFMWIYHQDEPFLVLADRAGQAYLDGYGRESVFNLASALERFFEFCIKVMLAKIKIDSASFEKTWKRIDNQSERQIGAFLFLYLAAFKENPDFEIFHSRNSEFRNKVIHKGHFPSDKDVHRYGDHVIGFIFLMLQKFRTSYKDEMWKVALVPPGMPKSSNGGPTRITTIGLPISFKLFLEDPAFGPQDFSALLDLVKKAKNFYDRFLAAY